MWLWGRCVKSQKHNPRGGGASLLLDLFYPALMLPLTSGSFVSKTSLIIDVCGLDAHDADLVAISWRDVVVLCSQIGRSHNVVHVEVAVIILLRW